MHGCTGALQGPFIKDRPAVFVCVLSRGWTTRRSDGLDHSARDGGVLRAGDGQKDDTSNPTSHWAPESAFFPSGSRIGGVQTARPDQYPESDSPLSCGTTGIQKGQAAVAGGGGGAIRCKTATRIDVLTTHRTHSLQNL